HVLRADAGVLAEQLGDPPEQRLLLFHGAGVEYGDLDVHDIGAPDDAVGITVAEVRRLMLSDGHELVIFGHVQRFAHRAVKAVEDCLPVGLRPSGPERDVNERHRGLSLYFWSWLVAVLCSAPVDRAQAQRIQFEGEVNSSTPPD